VIEQYDKVENLFILDNAPSIIMNQISKFKHASTICLSPLAMENPEGQTSVKCEYSGIYPLYKDKTMVLSVIRFPLADPIGESLTPICPNLQLGDRPDLIVNTVPTLSRWTNLLKGSSTSVIQRYRCRKFPGYPAYLSRSDIHGDDPWVVIIADGDIITGVGVEHKVHQIYYWDVKSSSLSISKSCAVTEVSTCCPESPLNLSMCEVIRNLNLWGTVNLPPDLPI
jgi:hypothetical protein